MLRTAQEDAERKERGQSVDQGRNRPLLDQIPTHPQKVERLAWALNGQIVGEEGAQLLLEDTKEEHLHQDKARDLQQEPQKWMKA